MAVGARAEAPSALALAGTSPAPRGGGARPGRRANEVPRKAGTPLPRPSAGEPTPSLQAPATAQPWEASGARVRPERRSPRPRAPEERRAQALPGDGGLLPAAACWGSSEAPTCLGGWGLLVGVGAKS